MPKARALYAEHTLKRPLESTSTLRFSDSSAYDHCIPVAILPCVTKAQAARICRVANMEGDDRIQYIQALIMDEWDLPVPIEHIKRVLEAIGLGGEATR